MDIEFKLSEAEGNAGEDSGDEEHKEGSHIETQHVDTKKYEDEINALKEHLQEIKRQANEFQMKNHNYEEQLQLKDGQIQSLQFDKDQAVKNLQSLSENNADE